MRLALTSIPSPTHELAKSNAAYGYHLIREFVTSNELTKLRKVLREKSDLFVQTSGYGPLGPRYNVIDGDKIRREIPALLSYGEKRVKPIVEAFASQPVTLTHNSRKAMRIQLYRNKEHNFRWHFDGHPYVALLTLNNTLRGQTHIISTKMSSVLHHLNFTRFYTLPHLLDFIPYQAVTMKERDLLLMRGSDVLHRGVSPEGKGERILLVYGYDVKNEIPHQIGRFARKTDNLMFS